MQLKVSPEVRDALHTRRPVVALETTVVTHGLDYPDNVQTALAMERTIRQHGACPATLGIVRGEITVGLSAEQIEVFASAPRDSVAKCSRRDLPAVLARRTDGSLTVAGTIMVAHAAGIDLFATGGIGGVHRGHPFDVSADLLELGRSPVAGVCAGAKSILDLPLTLEILETQGVPVVGIGTGNLPAFYAADSGLPLPVHAETLRESADILNAWRKLAAGNGILFTVPVPDDCALSFDEAELVIRQAVREADHAGIAGNRVTPFILSRVMELTGGRALAANKALLINNARTAALLATLAGQQ